MILNEIKEQIESEDTKNIYLYFITRKLKDDFKKSSKVMNKYLFKVYQIDINDEIRNHLHELTIEQLGFLLKRKTELHEYDVITDDTQNLFTYQMRNKAMSFSDVVTNQLKSNPPKISSIEKIILSEELWAYSVGFYSVINNKDSWIYSFRKILSGKVAIDEKDSNSRSSLNKTLRTIFNSESKKLELIEGETINLDKQIDCIYHQEIFYIAKKTQFEQIVGLEEEYKNEANEVIEELERTNLIDGIDIIKQQIDINPSIHKKLVRLSKLGNYKEMNGKNIKKMKKVSKAYGNELKIKDGKLFIENESDIDLALKMLADYYKKGEVSGKGYGTFAGIQLQQISN